MGHYPMGKAAFFGGLGTRPVAAFCRRLKDFAPVKCNKKTPDLAWKLARTFPIVRRFLPKSAKIGPFPLDTLATAPNPFRRKDLKFPTENGGFQARFRGN